MPLHYHVQRNTVPRFKVGKTYTFGAEPNFFARDLFATDVSVPVSGVGDLPIDNILRDYFDPSGFNHYRNVKRANYTADDKGLLSCAAAVLKHQAMLLRELIFEQVRQESFADKPSRLRCSWLIPHDEQILAHWCASAPNGQFRAYEVEANGRFHIGASKYLNPACLGGAVLRENAWRFWSEPVNAHAEHSEILLCGELTPLREINMPGSTQTKWAKLKRLF
jgi:Protein of unknown function (DUF2441)